MEAFHDELLWRLPEYADASDQAAILPTDCNAPLPWAQQRLVFGNQRYWLQIPDPKMDIEHWQDSALAR